jgi:ABC-type nitrate/sulfonate/bicarbonate transport system substrate-binding protein
VFVLEKFGLQEKTKLQPFGGTQEVDAAFRAGIIAGAVRSMRPGPKAHMLLDLPEVGIPFSMDLIAVKREFYKSSPATVEGMLQAYIEGVAAIRTKKEQTFKVLAKYMRAPSEMLDESYGYAVRYLDRVPKVDPAAIKTVLGWEGKSEMPVRDFFDNSIIDRLARDGFIDRLYKKEEGR